MARIVGRKSVEIKTIENKPIEKTEEKPIEKKEFKLNKKNK